MIKHLVNLKGCIRMPHPGCKKVIVEVIDAPLGYNLVLGYRFKYTMKVVFSYMYHTMSFSHIAKIIMYYDP